MAPRSSSVAALIGDTPMVRLKSFEPRRGVEIRAKLERHNPGGSVKDRAALAIVRDARDRGALKAGVRLLDATSGNTGIAYAMLGAAEGFGVTLCLPASANDERKRLLRAYGAEILLTEAAEGSDGAIRRARQLAKEDPGRFYYADQYNNPANPRAHYSTTGPEVWRQSRGRVTHFVAGLGTSGTLMGVGRFLKERKPAVRLAAVQPDSPLHGLEGLKHMESAIVPGIYDPTLHEDLLRVGTEEAQDLVRRLARQEGILAGPSSGAALAGALRLAQSLHRAVIVTLFPDGGERYLSERFWELPA